MTIDLYQLPGSSPCRTVRLVAAALGVKLNLKPCDLMKGEHLKPEYLKVRKKLLFLIIKKGKKNEYNFFLLKASLFACI